MQFKIYNLKFKIIRVFLKLRNNGSIGVGQSGMFSFSG